MKRHDRSLTVGIDPKTWATGGDPATDKQKSFLSTLASEKGEEIDIDNIEKVTKILPQTRHVLTLVRVLLVQRLSV